LKWQFRSDGRLLKSEKRIHSQKNMGIAYIEKQAMEQQLYGTGRGGRSKLRWVDSVAQDAGNMGINNWKKAAQDRERWRRLLPEAKTRQGL
jgi:hypothetical protein